MNYQGACYLIRSDLHRYAGKTSFLIFIKHFLINRGFKYSVYLRLCNILGRKAIWKYSIFVIIKMILKHHMIKYGISIPHTTKIGSGFFIGHIGGIVISSRAKIGKNCNISQNVTIGKVNRGKRKGFPIIGDNVYIGPGAVISGNIKVGDNVAIGANCVVVSDVPDNGVVVGVPGKVISFKSSAGYVNKIDY